MNHSISVRCLIAGFLTSLASVASGQTTWTGADGGSITTAGNWDNGLPSISNVGTIPGSTTNINFNSSLNGYHLIQDGGAVTSTSFRQVSNGSWTLNGGSISTPNNFQLGFVDNTNQLLTVNSGGAVNVTGGWMEVSSSSGTGRTATVQINGGTINSNEVRGQNGGTIDMNSGAFNVTGNNFNLNSGSSMDISGGTVTMTSSGRSFLINAGASFNMTGGSLEVVNTGRDFQVSTGGTATISGGTITSARSIIVAGDLTLNGGTLTAATSLVSNAGFNLELGGTNAGSLTAATLGGTATNRNINWLTGSQMTMTITGSADWAETEWAAGRMFYNGQDFNTLGSWVAVNGTIFDWDGGTNTLALIPVPEPSTFALLAGMFGFVWVMLRRR